MIDTPSTTTTFESFPYTRPDLEVVSRKFNASLQNFEQATSPEEQIQSLKELIHIREEFATMYNLCLIRHTVDTRDPFYETENTYFDENLPAFEALNDNFYRALLKSPFRTELAQKYGGHLFVLADLALKTFTDHSKRFAGRKCLQHRIHQIEGNSPTGI